jgi:hypothetical protein
MSSLRYTSYICTTQITCMYVCIVRNIYVKYIHTHMHTYMYTYTHTRTHTHTYSKNTQNTRRRTNGGRTARLRCIGRHGGVFCHAPTRRHTHTNGRTARIDRNFPHHSCSLDGRKGELTRMYVSSPFMFCFFGWHHDWCFDLCIS